MTMPTTAMGIWAYSGWPKVSSSAPYFCSILLMAAIAATSEICARKLQIPSGMKRFVTVQSTRRLSFFRSTAFMWQRYRTAMAAVRI